MSDARPTLNAEQMRHLLSSIGVIASSMAGFSAYDADRSEGRSETQYDWHAMQTMAERIEAMAEAVDTGHVSKVFVGPDFSKAKEASDV